MAPPIGKQLLYGAKIPNPGTDWLLGQLEIDGRYIDVEDTLAYLKRLEGRGESGRDEGHAFMIKIMLALQRFFERRGGHRRICLYAYDTYVVCGVHFRERAGVGILGQAQRAAKRRFLDFEARIGQPGTLGDLNVYILSTVYSCQHEPGFLSLYPMPGPELKVVESDRTTDDVQSA